MTQLISTNPGKNYEIVGELAPTSFAEIEAKVAAAKDAKKIWKETNIDDRITILKQVYQLCEAKRDELIKLASQEMGKCISECEHEFNSMFLNCFAWFLDNAKSALADEYTYKDGETTNRIVYEPYGLAAVILPWNFPLEMFVWGVIPNLLVSNTVVMKMSEECPLIGNEFAKIMEAANLPAGVFSAIHGDGQVGEHLVNQDIDFLWFTGSSHVGKHLFSLVGQKPKFVKSLMELGGSSPGIVFADADIDSVLTKICSARLLNAGQACSALKRLIVHESRFDEVVEKLTTKFKEIKVGPPLESSTQMGSLAAKRQLELVASQVDDALAKGAQATCGAQSPENLDGAFYLPTILTNISRNMRVWQEEVFGPVLPIISFKTDAEAIELANDTPYGLTAYVFTEDKDKFEQIAAQINAGRISLNTAGPMTSATPFGGYKMSGIGRELGLTGFRELCQIKVVCR